MSVKSLMERETGVCCRWRWAWRFVEDVNSSSFHFEFVGNASMIISASADSFLDDLGGVMRGEGGVAPRVFRLAAADDLRPRIRVAVQRRLWKHGSDVFEYGGVAAACGVLAIRGPCACADDADGFDCMLHSC